MVVVDFVPWKPSWSKKSRSAADPNSRPPAPEGIRDPVRRPGDRESRGTVVGRDPASRWTQFRERPRPARLRQSSMRPQRFHHCWSRVLFELCAASGHLHGQDFDAECADAPCQHNRTINATGQVHAAGRPPITFMRSFAILRGDSMRKVAGSNRTRSFRRQRYIPYPSILDLLRRAPGIRRFAMRLYLFVLTIGSLLAADPDRIFFAHGARPRPRYLFQCRRRRGASFAPVHQPRLRSLVVARRPVDLFTSERDGSADLYRVEPDGTGIEPLTDNPAYDGQAAFSPGGDRIVFVAPRANGHANLWFSICVAQSDAPHFRRRWRQLPAFVIS